MSRTIIITGATGKFGKILVKYFLESGDKVVAIGKSKNLLNQLKNNTQNSIKNLYLVKANLMAKNGYGIISFPGTSTNFNQYESWHKSKENSKLKK